MKVWAMRSMVALLAPLCLVLSAGCVGWGDIFLDQRQLVSGFYLERFDSSEPTLGSRSRSAYSGGILRGAVKEVGWNDEFILARTTPLTTGDRSGWMIVRVKTESVEGPFSDTELSELRVNRPGLASIKTVPVETLW